MKDKINSKYMTHKIYKIFHEIGIASVAFYRLINHKLTRFVFK